MLEALLFLSVMLSALKAQLSSAMSVMLSALKLRLSSAIVTLFPESLGAVETSALKEAELVMPRVEPCC